MSDSGTNSRKLWLIRHGDAEAHSSTGRDIDRPLSPRAEAEAGAMVPWLADGAPPSIVLHSTAQRTTQTAERVLSAWHLSEEQLLPEASLYLASADDLLDTVRGLSHDWPVAALVGHNPGISQFACSLAGRSDLALPTFGCVLLSGPSDWLQWHWQHVDVVAHQTP